MLDENAIYLQPESTRVSACQAVPVSVARKAAAFLRIAKPGIVTAELAAALAGILLASQSVPTVSRFFWTMICVALAASGAAMANGLIDAASDRLMPRLAVRCRALDLVGEKHARAAAAGCIGMSLVLSVIFLNTITVLLLGGAVFSYLFLYSARMKRISPLAVLTGGIPGAFPPLIGAAAAGSVSASAVLLAVVLYVWQLPHFWFIALQYREQYQKAGVPVFPLVYGERLTKKLILVCNALLIPLSLSITIFSVKSYFCTLLLFFAGVILFLSSVWSVRLQYRYRFGFLWSLAYLTILLTALITVAVVRQQSFMATGNFS